MSAPSNFVTLGQLIRDTFRQACASGICAMMLVVTGLCVVLCLSVRVWGDVPLQGEDEPILFLPAHSARTGASGTPERQRAGLPVEFDPEQAKRDGIETISGRMSLAFGAVSFPVSRERADAVHFIELVLAGGFAGTLGLLLALVWTAGFIPSFLEPSAASVLLAKPVARWQLIFGKYVGVLTFVGFQVVLFVVSTWLALGLRTHVWSTTYWWCIPLLLLQFAIFFSVSVLLAVIMRSTVACVFGSVLFWLLAWGINYGCVMARSVREPQSLPAGTVALAEGAYWIFPKPIDAGVILFNALDAKHHFEMPFVFQLLGSSHAFSPHLSILSSLAFTGVMLALSTYEFNALDY